MGRIKLVVVDLDGTLADTLPDIAGALEKVTAKYGAYGDLQQLVRKSIGNGARKLVERVFDALGISKENLEADLAEYRAGGWSLGSTFSIRPSPTRAAPASSIWAGR